MFARTSIGGLLIEDVEDWTFAVQDGVIAARFRDDPGILRITTTASNTLQHPVTHEVCLSRAAALADVVAAKPSDWIRSEAVSGPYGSANFDRGSDRVYVWYCSRAPGLIVGTYSCSAEASRTFENRALRMRCNCMVTTAVFDRRVWGADDEFTRLLTALLSADDVTDK